jgi:hypothetical protein
VEQVVPRGPRAAGRRRVLLQVHQLLCDPRCIATHQLKLLPRLGRSEHR